MPSIALPVSLRGQLLSGSRFNPISLFSAGEQGIWLDPSDLTTMFQDRAGTTPVTTPGQTVGLRLDKSKGLVLGSELVTNGDFSSDTWWTKGAGATISGGKANFSASSGYVLNRLGVSGIVTGGYYEVTFTVSDYVSGSIRPYLGSTPTFGTAVTANGTYTARFSPGSGTEVGFNSASAFTGSIDNVSIKAITGNHAVAPTDAARPTYGIEPWSGRRNLLLATDTMATQSLTVAAVAHTLAFTGTGTVTLTGASIAGPLIGTGASNRVSLTFTPTAASLTLTVVGSVTLAQLELGSTATAYQRVGTAFDVTEAGVPTVHYVQYDGTDDSFSTSSINFTATDKMSVFAGVKKLSDALRGMAVEIGSGGANGSFAMEAPDNNGAITFAFRSIGTSAAVTSFAANAAPITRIVTGLGNIAAPSSIIRLDGVQVNQNTNTQGTGNYGNYPLFIGRRNNATIPFNGRDYGIIVVGKTASASEIYSTESYLAANTSGVSI